MATNPLPDYYHLLLQAQAASDRADGYDVRSEDPVSSAEWARLCAESAAAQLALTLYVLSNGLALLAAFKPQED